MVLVDKATHLDHSNIYSSQDTFHAGQVRCVEPTYGAVGTRHFRQNFGGCAFSPHRQTDKRRLLVTVVLKTMTVVVGNASFCL
jgi:hypothetical protein